MSGKKLVIIIVSALAALALLGVLFVGGIVGFIFYKIGNSEAATTAKNFLRNNQRLERDIGEVRDFGWLVTGNINASGGGAGEAVISVKAIGERETVNATVRMVYAAGGAWRVVGASYENGAGRNVELPIASRERRITPEQVFGPSAGDDEGGANRF